MPVLKMFGLFIFLIVFSDTGAQVTEPASVLSTVPEEPDGTLLSERSSENITHINSDKLNGHLESDTLEVLPEKSVEEHSAEVDADSAAISENSQPSDTESVKNYKREDILDDDLLSASLLAPTDRSGYDGETATKDLTDGLEYHNPINKFDASGSFIAANQEDSNTDKNEANFNKFVNAALEKEDISTKDYERYNGEATGEDIFSTSDPENENDKKLFDLDDPSDMDWLKHEDITYSYNPALLKEIEELFARGTSESSYKHAVDDEENSGSNWNHSFNVTTETHNKEEENVDSETSVEATKESDVKKDNYEKANTLEAVIPPQLNSLVGNDIATTPANPSESSINFHENYELKSDENGEAGKNSAEIQGNESEAEAGKIDEANERSTIQDILGEVTEPTVVSPITESVGVPKNDNHKFDSDVSTGEVAEISDKPTTPVGEENQDNGVQNFDESTDQKSEETKESTTESYGHHTTGNDEYPVTLITTNRKNYVNDNNGDENVSKNSDIEDTIVPNEANEKDEEFLEDNVVASTTDRYTVYKASSSEHELSLFNEEVPAETTLLTDEQKPKYFTDDFKEIISTTETDIHSDGHLFKSTESEENSSHILFTENKKSRDTLDFDSMNQQSTTMFPATNVVHQSNLEESTEIPNEDYSTDSSVDKEHLVTSFAESDKNVTTPIKVDEDEPIISTTETDNEGISTSFFEHNYSHSNEKEETEYVESTTLIHEETVNHSIDNINNSTTEEITATTDINSKIHIENERESGEVNVSPINDIHEDNSEESNESTTSKTEIIIEGSDIPATTTNNYSTFTETGEQISTTAKDNNLDKEEEHAIPIEASNGNEEISEDKSVVSTTAKYNEERITFYGDNFWKFDSNEKEESELIKNTTPILAEEDINHFTDTFLNSTTEEIGSTTQLDKEENEDFKEVLNGSKDESGAVESMTSVLIQEETAKYFTDSYTSSTTDKVTTATESYTKNIFTTIKNSYFNENNDDENISGHTKTERIDIPLEVGEENEELSDEINVSESQKTESPTESYSTDITGNEYATTAFAESSGEENPLNNFDGEDNLMVSSTEMNNENVSSNEEQETDSMENTSSIKEGIINSVTDSTIEEITATTEIKSEVYGIKEVINNGRSSKVIVDVTESYVKVRNDFVTTAEVTEEVIEEITIKTPSSSKDIYEYDSHSMETNTDYIITDKDDYEINKVVVTTHRIFSENQPIEDDNVTENESTESTINMEYFTEKVFIETEKENTDTLNIDSTTAYSFLDAVDDKNLQIAINKLFDNINTNLTTLINDTLKKLTTENNSYNTESESSENYSDIISSSEEITTETEENTMVSSNEVSAINISKFWSTFGPTLLGGRSNNYDESIEEDRSIEKYENISNVELNADETGTESMEEFLSYISGDVFGNRANVSIRIDIQDTSFYVPPSADFQEDSGILNITWTSLYKLQNNSVSLMLKENPRFYTVQSVQLTLVHGSDVDIWNQTLSAVSANDTIGKTGLAVDFDDDVRISLSNLDFLRLGQDDTEFNSTDIASMPSAIRIDTKEIGIATGCVAAALFVCATIYFVIARSRKRVVNIANLTKHDIPV